MSRIQDLADCILSDQVPASRVPALVDENPGLREELQRRRDADAATLATAPPAWPAQFKGHWLTAEGAIMAQNMVGKPRSFDHITDFELANWVFMCGRSDLQLIAAQTAAKERLRWLSAHLAAERLKPDPLAWLAAHRNCELSHHYGDDAAESDEWRVHRVNGGRNDREWTLIGKGATPAEALAEAMRK